MYKVTLINGGIETVIHHHNFNNLKVQEGQIKTGINVATGFTFTILPGNVGYNLIRSLKTLIKVFNTQTQKYEFEGRILMPTESMGSNGLFAKTFICESELGFLNDSAQRHGEYHDISVRNLLEIIIANHNDDVGVDKTFVVGEVTVTGNLYRYLGYDSTLDAINDNLISRLGGELRVRKENGIRYLDYLIEVGEVKTTEIRLSKNLKSITKETDPSEIITKLIPLGQSIESEDETDTDASQARLTITSVNGGNDYIVDEDAMSEFGIVAKSMTWDDITLPSNLLTRGQQFLQENNRVKVKHSISTLDLSLIGLDTDSFDTGNYYPVINPVMAINETLRVIEKVTDIINPNENNLVVGDLFKTTAEYQHEANQSAKKIVDLQSLASRQAQTISAIKAELNAVDIAVQQVQITISDSDLPALEDAIDSLNEALDNLVGAIDDIPVYEVATTTIDGLMSAIDKTKLNSLQAYELVTELVNGLMAATDKTKLNKITVINTVDLDALVARVEALENV